MLWQPSLHESYIQAKPDELAKRIAARKRELGDRLIILGHHYQTDEVIQHADFTGDSLKLAQLATQRVAASGAKHVIFCGVHFMAETADMLTPDDVAVILPDLSAGCSMADMADYDDTVLAWTMIHEAMAAEKVKARVIPVTYINSTAAIKAFVGEHGGAVCTSSNARMVLEWAMAGGDEPLKKGEAIKVLFLPDQHLGRNTAASMGMDVASETCVYDPRLTRKGEGVGGSSRAQIAGAKVILWAGHCSVHKLFRPEHCEQIRAADAGLPEAQRTRILVHPECTKEVVDLADLAGSTEYIIRTIDEAPKGSRWAVGTEYHLVMRVAERAKARRVEVRILSECQCLCTTMYRIDQPHLCWVLDQLAAGKTVNQIKVHPKVRTLALLGLERMLRLTSGAAPAVKTDSAQWRGRAKKAVSSGAGD